MFGNLIGIDLSKSWVNIITASLSAHIFEVFIRPLS